MPEHVQKEILLLKIEILARQKYCYRRCDFYEKERFAKNLQKRTKRHLVVTNKQPDNHDVFKSSRFSPGMKTYAGAIRTKEKKKIRVDR